MADLPMIAMVATTYFPPGDVGHARAVAFGLALESWDAYLKYPPGVGLLVCDDGSAPELNPSVQAAAYLGNASRRMPLLGGSRQERHGVGASLNAGFSMAQKFNPLVLYAVDDWELTAPFDLETWARLLMDDPSIGCVRFHPHAGLRGEIKMIPGVGHILDPQIYGYVFSFRPALYHRRFIDIYGPFPEDCSALEAERLYNEHYARWTHDWLEMPRIVYALAEPWVPIYSVDLSSVDPTR